MRSASLNQGFWPKDKVVAIAHRGGDAAGKDKESTLEAYQAAWKLGYRYAEADVVLAASGELVVVHGSHNWIHAGFGRGITTRVLQMMTLDQIRYLITPGGAQAPLLDEVLSSFPKMKFILDVKSPEVVEPLAKKLKMLKATQRICVSGYDYGRALRFSQACQPHKVTTGLTVGRGIRFRNMNQLMLKSGQLSGVEAIFMHHSLVSGPMVNLVHHRGFKAIVWTANSRLAIRHAVRSGADGIISDRVNLLKKTLDSKN
jgi:glycerophosphoryl diester phosphodiesterase